MNVLALRTGARQGVCLVMHNLSKPGESGLVGKWGMNLNKCLGYSEHSWYVSVKHAAFGVGAEHTEKD